MSQENNAVATAESTQTDVTKGTIHDPNISFEQYEALRNGEKKSVSTEVVQKDETAEESETSDALEAEAKPENQEDEEQDSEEEESQENADLKPKKKSGFQKRIGKLAKKLSDKDQLLSEKDKRIALLEEQINGKKGQPETEAKVKPAADDRPNQDDFATHAEYVEALTDWKMDQRDKQNKQKEQDDKLVREFQEKSRSLKSKVQEFLKTHEDYADVLDGVDDIPMSIGVHQEILKSDVGPQLMYELAKNREEYERINALEDSRAVAREIGKIEARIAASSETETKQIPEKKLTKTSAPIAPVGNRGSATVKKSIYDKDISFAEYERLRTEELKRKK